MIRVNNVCKKYHTNNGWKTVLKDINFELKKGEKIGILGRNGAGKSTLIRRLYDVDPEYVTRFTKEFSELGDYLYEPVKKYSSGMKARLAFALSLSVEFDCYLIDEVIAVGDSRFAEKCKYELFEKRKDRSIILVSHSPSAMRAYCDNAVVLENGIMHHFEDMDKAYQYYNETQK